MELRERCECVPAAATSVVRAASLRSEPCVARSFESAILPAVRSGFETKAPLLRNGASARASVPSNHRRRRREASRSRPRCRPQVGLHPLAWPQRTGREAWAVHSIEDTPRTSRTLPETRFGFGRPGLRTDPCGQRSASRACVGENQNGVSRIAPHGGRRGLCGPGDGPWDCGRAQARES